MIDWRTLGHWQALEDAKKEAERKLEASVPPAAGTTPALGSREPAAPARPPLALFSLPPQGSGPAAGALLGHAVSPPAAAVVLAPLTLARLAAMLHKAQSTNPSGGSDNLGDLLLRCAAFARPTPLRAPLLGSPGFCGLCGFCGLVASTVFEFRARTRCGGRSGWAPSPPKFSRRLKVICAGYGRFGPKKRRKCRFAAGGHGFRGLAGLGRRGERLPSRGPGWGSFWRRQHRGPPRGSPPARVSSPVFGGFCAFLFFWKSLFFFFGIRGTGLKFSEWLYRLVW